MSDHDARVRELERQVAYFRDHSERLARSLLHADAAVSAQRHELEHKRRGISLLARIMAALGPADELETFRSASLEINPALNMQRTAVLMPVGDGRFRAAILQGYERGEARRIAASGRPVPRAILEAQAPLVVTKESPADALADLREWLALPYFVVTPVRVQQEVAAVVVTGRLRERHPFMPRLGDSDAETMQTVAAFLGAVLTQKRLAEVEHLANHDPLTGLPNLRLGHERLLSAIAAARRHGTGTALLYVDLDGFKRINDGYGHKAGDAALLEIGRRLQGLVRETDTIARIGGDEFIVVLPHTAVGALPTRVADGILQAISEPVAWEGRALHVGASIGLAVYPTDGGTADELISAADSAMYSVKRDGKHAYRVAGRRDRLVDMNKHRTVRGGKPVSAITNGVNMEELGAYLKTVQGNADLARVRFRATSTWGGGCRTDVRVSEIRAGGELAVPPDRRHDLRVDEPPALGGHDTAPNPVEYLAAGLCGCLTAGIATNAALFETGVESIEVEVDADFDVLGLLGLDRSVATGAQRIHYTVRLQGPGAAEALERAKETIDRKSPVANTLRGAVDVTTDVVVEG